MAEKEKLSISLIREVEEKVAQLYDDFKQYQSDYLESTNEKIKCLESDAKNQIAKYEKDNREFVDQTLFVMKKEQDEISQNKIDKIQLEIQQKQQVLVDKIIQEVFNRYGS